MRFQPPACAGRTTGRRHCGLCELRDGIHRPDRRGQRTKCHAQGLARGPDHAFLSGRPASAHGLPAQPTQCLAEIGHPVLIGMLEHEMMASTMPPSVIHERSRGLAPLPAQQGSTRTDRATILTMEWQSRSEFTAAAPFESKCVHPPGLRQEIDDEATPSRSLPLDALSAISRVRAVRACGLSRCATPSWFRSRRTMQRADAFVYTSVKGWLTSRMIVEVQVRTAFSSWDSKDASSAAHGRLDLHCRGSAARAVDTPFAVQP